MTKKKKRHPAAASRVLAGGLSTAAVLAITGGLAAGQPASPSPPQPRRQAHQSGAPRDLRVVVTDDRIDARDAVIAAKRALRRGQDEAYVEVDPLPPLVRYVTVAQPATASLAAPAPAAASAPPPNAGHTSSSGS